MNTKLEMKLSWMIALLAVAAVMLTVPQIASADDDDPPERVARLSYIQGSVSFQPAGEPDWVQAFTNRPVTTGDRIWADQGARAELDIGAATVRLNGSTGFSFLNLDDRTTQIELTEGTIDIRVRRLDRDEIFEVDTPNQAFSILRPGRYRLQASEDGNSTYVIVRNGEGEATGAGQTYTMRSGESGTFTGTDQLYADIYDASDRDDFDNWGDGRDRRYDDSQSARYVSPDVVGYEDLDDYGSWRSEPEYGSVWVPTRVDSQWAPYRNGHWAWISPWGWTWVDDEPWGYAPFHYGRWVSLRGRWCWVPGPRQIRPVYAPALVVFIGGGQFGGGGGFGVNVAWFPLGPREVYVPSYNVSRRYVERVNISNTTVNTTTITNIYNTQITNNNVTNTRITYVNRTVRGGVTAVPQSTFASAQPVARSVVVVNQQQIAAASITRRAPVAPTRNSVLGPSASNANRVARPSAAVMQRAVVAKAPPPPPPVSFEKQQRALAAHPGQPLARHEVETLRPANVATQRPQVKQAPPGKAATPNRNRATGQPAGGNPRQPANAPPSNAPANTPANEANAPGQRAQPTRSDRPPSTQQEKARERQAGQQQQQDRTRDQQPGQQQQDRTREQQPGQQQQDKARERQAGQQQQQDQTPQQQPNQQQQQDRTREQQPSQQQQQDKARERQAGQQQQDRTREQQPNQQQQQDKARERQAGQRQQDQTPQQQPNQQQQQDRAREQQPNQQQQKDNAREQQPGQQQRQDRAREQQVNRQQQQDKAREQQGAQQQPDQSRQRQADPQQPEKARQRQADQQRPDRPPNAQPGERQKQQPSEAQPKRPQTKAEKDREEQKKREEQPPQ
jgi:hypothetical protein